MFALPWATAETSGHENPTTRPHSTSGAAVFTTACRHLPAPLRESCRVRGNQERAWLGSCVLTYARFLIVVLHVVVLNLHLLHTWAGNAWNVRKVRRWRFGNRRIAALHQKLAIINNPGTWRDESAVRRGTRGPGSAAPAKRGRLRGSCRAGAARGFLGTRPRRTARSVPREGAAAGQSPNPRAEKGSLHTARSLNPGGAASSCSLPREGSRKPAPCGWPSLLRCPSSQSKTLPGALPRKLRPEVNPCGEINSP